MDEYAPQYSDEEKLKIIGLHALWIVPLALLAQFVWKPWFNTTNWFLCDPHGYEVLFYGICVGWPLFCILVSINNISESLKTIKLKQYPLPAQKTFYKTKYVYGLKATFRSYFFLIGMIALIGIAIFGFFVASNILDKDSSIPGKNRKAACPTSSSLK